MAGVKRTIKNTQTIDQGGINSLQHNPYSGAKKSLATGPEFQKVIGAADVTGVDISTAAGIAPGTLVWLFNNSATVGWVALKKDIAPTTVSGFANAIPLAPNSWMQLCVGDNNFIKSSAATIGMYIVQDDATYAAAVIE
jgi:hypothetical protein